MGGFGALRPSILCDDDGLGLTKESRRPGMVAKVDGENLGEATANRNFFC